MSTRRSMQPVALALSIVGGAVAGHQLNRAIVHPMPFRVRPSTVGAVGMLLVSVAARGAGLTKTSQIATSVAIGMSAATIESHARPRLLAQPSFADARPASGPPAAGSLGHAPEQEPKKPLTRAEAFAGALGAACGAGKDQADQLLERLRMAGFRVIRPKRLPTAGWIVERAVGQRIAPLFVWALGTEGRHALQLLVAEGWRFARKPQVADLAPPRSGLERRDFSGLAPDAPTPRMFPTPPGFPSAAPDRAMGARFRVG